MYRGGPNQKREVGQFRVAKSTGIRSYCESFNGKLRDECLNGEIFYSLREAQIVIEQWRVEYNTRRPHSALGYRPPAPAAIAPQFAALRSPAAPCEPQIAQRVL
jgi:putative transposase